MSGAIFQVGENKVRPGIYFRSKNAGQPVASGIPKGICAAIFQADWGPLGQVVTLENINQVSTVYLDGGTTIVPIECFKGNAKTVKAFRLGNSGTGSKATKNLQDTTGSPIDAVKADAKYVGAVTDIKITIRDSLSDANKRECLIYKGTALKKTYTFDKGSSGIGEPAALVAAAAADPNQWVDFTKLADGNKILAALTQSALSGGANPTVNGTSYSDALSAIESVDWNTLAIDTNDTATHATVQTYIDRVVSEGKRVLGVIGEPTSVALATRQADAKAFNDVTMIYVLNGFIETDGTEIEGYKAAARVAGMIAASSYRDSLTHAIVTGAVEIKGGLTNSEIESSLQSGAIVFTKNANDQVQIEYGINTLVTPSGDQDAGWKKIRRTRTRYELMDRIASIWDPLIGKIDNSKDGQAILVGAAQGVVNQMIKEGGFLDGAQVKIDPDNQPSGDQAWFVFEGNDVDSAEKLYLTFGFRFAPETT